jgi:homocysteine S-methyltransferase
MGCSRTKAEELMLKSVALARAAVDQYFETVPHNSPRPLVAASIGPYGAYLADGSEYRGDYSASDQELIDFHSDRILLFAESNADLLAFETFPSFREARIIGQLISDISKPSWLSFSCKDGRHISDGTAIKTCIQHFSNHKTIFALGVNCTHPRFITNLINEIKPVIANKKVIIYPNSGETYDAKTKTWRGISDPLVFVDAASQWIEAGADIIGGCCRLGPNHIRSLSKLAKHPS